VFSEERGFLLLRTYGPQTRRGFNGFHFTIESGIMPPKRKVDAAPASVESSPSKTKAARAAAGGAHVRTRCLMALPCCACSLAGAPERRMGGVQALLPAPADGVRGAHCPVRSALPAPCGARNADRTGQCAAPASAGRLAGQQRMGPTQSPREETAVHAMQIFIQCVQRVRPHARTRTRTHPHACTTRIHTPSRRDCQSGGDRQSGPVLHRGRRSVVSRR
jgi:hypothetical protein